MKTRYSDWVREHEGVSGYGWVKYRWVHFGTTKVWHFWELEKFRKFIAEHANQFMWAMIFSAADGAFYYDGNCWRPSSGARLSFSRDKAAGKVLGLAKTS